jgi:septal ring factor EnvC (AmiA/AmiB activator)
MIAGRYIFLCFLLVISFSSLAQKTKAQLQKEKQENLEKIKETEKILAETSEEKKTSIGELNALNNRIGQQETLVTSIKGEISLLDYDIEENNEIIAALQKDIGKLKEEYAAMLFAAQKASGKADKLTFLFSATSFEQLLMRLKYMEQYGKARKEQAEAIVRVQHTLEMQVQTIEAKREEKKQLLSDEQKESTHLTDLKQKQKTLVKSLEKEEKRLKRDLEDTKKAVAELDELIANIIKEELERAAREAREAREKNKSVKEPEVVEAAVALSASFEENKNKFGWPVSGFISQKFGRQHHPVLKGIEIQNDGVNIQTKQGEHVKVIFDGEVRAVAFIPGIGNTVLVNHGDFFTVYSGLKDVAVKKGQKVNTSTEIGQVISNKDGISELRFKIFRNTTALDPQQWLRN